MSDGDPAVVGVARLLTWAGIPVMHNGRRAWGALLIFVLMGVLSAAYRWYYDLSKLSSVGPQLARIANVNIQFRILLYLTASGFMLRQAFRRKSVQGIVMSDDHLAADRVHSKLTENVLIELVTLVAPVALLQAGMVVWFMGVREIPALAPDVPVSWDAVTRIASICLVLLGSTYSQVVFMLPCVLFRVNCAQGLHRVKQFRVSFLPYDVSMLEATAPPNRAARAVWRVQASLGSSRISMGVPTS